LARLLASRAIRSGLQAAHFHLSASEPAVIRWIAFDSQTEAAINQQFRPDSVEIQAGDPLCAALSQPHSTVLVLPSTTEGNVVVARIRMIERKSEKLPHELSFEPSGFLGLSDSPIFEDESPAPQKKWWQWKKTA